MIFNKPHGHISDAGTRSETAVQLISKRLGLSVVNISANTEVVSHCFSF